MKITFEMKKNVKISYENKKLLIFVIATYKIYASNIMPYTPPHVSQILNRRGYSNWGNPFWATILSSINLEL